MMSKYTKHVKDIDGNPRGIEHPALFADHSLYEVSFPNGRTEELTENVITESMLSRVDSEGNHYQVLNDIIENSADGRALKRSDELIRSRGGNLKSKKATIGWKFEFE